MQGDEAISLFSPRLGFCMSRPVSAHALFSPVLSESVWIRILCVGVCHRSGQGPHVGLGLEL